VPCCFYDRRSSLLAPPSVQVAAYLLSIFWRRNSVLRALIPTVFSHQESSTLLSWCRQNGSGRAALGLPIDVDGRSRRPTDYVVSSYAQVRQSSEAMPVGMRRWRLPHHGLVLAFLARQPAHSASVRAVRVPNCKKANNRSTAVRSLSARDLSRSLPIERLDKLWPQRYSNVAARLPASQPAPPAPLAFCRPPCVNAPAVIAANLSWSCACVSPS